MKLGSLAIRGVVGPLFIGHGAQKLFGKFGGHGPEGTGQFFEQLGLRPGRRHAVAAGWAEMGGGTLLLLGALTPVAASLISGSMITATRKAHANKGPWVTEGGYEYNLVLLAAMVAVTDYGPGEPSVDEAAFPWMQGPLMAALELAAAAAGSFVTTDVFGQATGGPREGQAPVGGDPAAPGGERFSREPSEVGSQNS
jgi:putative oxidoreductase